MLRVIELETRTVLKIPLLILQLVVIMNFIVNCFHCFAFLTNLCKRSKFSMYIAVCYYCLSYPGFS